MIGLPLPLPRTPSDREAFERTAELVQRRLSVLLRDVMYPVSRRQILRAASSRGADEHDSVVLRVLRGELYGGLSEIVGELMRSRIDVLALAMDGTGDVLGGSQAVGTERGRSADVTRDRSGNADSGGQWPQLEAELESYGRELYEMLLAVEEEDARIVVLRFGLVDGAHHSAMEVARRCGVSVRHVNRIAAQFLRGVRRDALPRVRRRSARELAHLRGALRQRAFGSPVEGLEPLVVFCDRHGRRHLIRAWERTCGWCGCIASLAANGRPRLYCSQGCKQASYRARRRWATLPSGEL